MGRVRELTLPSPLSTRVMSWTPLQKVWLPLVVAVGYYAGCLAGFALRFPESGISFFWPPTAVLAAALMMTSPRAWPALVGGTFLAHAIAHAEDGVPIGAWPIQFFGNASQAALAAWIVRRYASVPPLFSDLRRVLLFIVGACLIAPAAASVVPSFVYVNLGWASDFAHAWRARTVSNVVASLTLIPSLVVLWQSLAAGRIRVPPRLVEYGLLLFGIVAAHVATGFVERQDVLGFSVALYAPAPFLLWATVRFGAPGLSFALLWTTILMALVVSAGAGPLAGTPADTLVGVQLLVAASAVPMMLVAGLLEQNRTAHEILADVEQQNSAILRVLPDQTFLQSCDGVYLQCYPNGHGDRPAPAEAPGRHMRDVLPPDVAGALAHAFEAVRSDAPSIVEYTRVVDGAPRRYEGRCIAVDDDRVLTVVRDITDRWRSEQALREAERRYAFATSAGGIGVWDLDLQTGAVCVEGAMISGYAQHEMNRLTNWFALIHHADRDEMLARLRAYMSGASASFEAEFRMTHKDGSLRWLATRGAITERVNGLPSRMVGTYADVTERKEAARALSEANDALARTGRIAAIGEFSASIAHELNQPLTAIAMNATACLRSMDMAAPVVDLREALCDVVKDCRRASDIVARTRELFANEPVQKRPLSLNDVVRTTLEIAEARLRDTGARVKVTLADDVPDVLADAVQMQQVLLNLIINAVEAMQEVPEHRRELRITSRRSRRGVVVSVRDSGKGFDPNEARRLFAPFYTTKAAGLGLGLVISASIVKSHGGALWAAANVDRGATFRFRIPVLEQGEPAVS